MPAQYAQLILGPAGDRHLVAAHDVILVMDNSGRIAGDVRPLARMNVQVIVEQDGKREQGSAGGGARRRISSYRMIARSAMPARRAPGAGQPRRDTRAGRLLPVVLGPGWPGVLLHEAVGHGLEGDFNRKGTSAFTRAYRRAGCLDTVYRGRRRHPPGRRGSLTIDDEGTIGQQRADRKRHPRLYAGHDECPTDGRGPDRQWPPRILCASWPMPRMTNTYMFCRDSTNPTRSSPRSNMACMRSISAAARSTSRPAKFVFSANEAYLIENGKGDRPVKGATLIGNGPEAMTRYQHGWRRSCWTAVSAPAARKVRGAGRRRPAHPENRSTQCRRHCCLSHPSRMSHPEQIASCSRS